MKTLYLTSTAFTVGFVAGGLVFCHGMAQMIRKGKADAFLVEAKQRLGVKTPAPTVEVLGSFPASGDLVAALREAFGNNRRPDMEA